MVVLNLKELTLMNEELKELIKAKLDVTQFLDLLGWDLSDLVEALSEEIDTNADIFTEACR
jgi:hypothetical protein